MNPFTLKTTRTLVAPLLVCLLLSCGGGGGGGGDDDGGSAALPNAMVTVALTDAASDDISSFLVDITDIRITHSSGAVTSILNTPLTVDLTDLADLSQVINAGMIPSGWYTSGSISLSLANARCVLTGQTTPATIEDADGNVLAGTVTLPLEFGSGAFDAIAGRHRLLELDFDLDQSATVDAGANTVTLEPTFVMRADRSDPKDLITIGTLGVVDTMAGTFTAEVRRLGGVQIGTVTLATGLATVFQIDGVPLQGVAGLAALAAKPAGTWIQTTGAINTNALRIDVLYVEAGAGTYNGGSDIIEGHITGRSGGAGTDATLTVLGHSDNAIHDTFQFNRSFTVNTTFAGTRVVVPDSATVYTTNQLNIGQRVRVFGDISGTTMDARGASGVIRLQPTRVFGLANGAPAGGAVSINLSRVDLGPQNAFTWSQGGSTPPNPAAFTLLVGALSNGLGIVSGTAVEACGYFTGIDNDVADFAATSLTNYDVAPAFLRIHDLTEGLRVIPSFSSLQIRFAITGTSLPGEATTLDRGFLGVTTLPTSPVPAVVAAAGETLFAIQNGITGEIRLYSNFPEFSSALAVDVTTGWKIRNFGATGRYTAAVNRMVASLAVARIVPCDMNTVHLQSDPGDYIGAGRTYEYTQANTVITVSASGGHLSIDVEGDEGWSGEFQEPNGLTTLQPGTYTNAHRWPFQDPNQTGLAWSGEGRGSNTLTGWFAIDSVTYVGGTLTAIDLRFEQHSEGNAPALRGQIHWTSTDTTVPPGPIDPYPAGLWQPAFGSTPASGNFVYLKSDAGDYIGAGGTYTYTQADAVITVNSTGGLFYIDIEGDEDWTGRFKAMNTLSRLQVGYYGGLQGYPFHNPAKGGLDWSGEGRGDDGTGWFVVDAVTYVGDTLTAIDLRFEQHIGGGTPALRGQIHWTANDPTTPPGPVNPPPAGLWQPAAGSTPNSGNYVYLKSDPGDYIGAGHTYTYTQANAEITVNSSGGLLYIDIEGAQDWTGDFRTMNTLSRLQVGYYGGLHRYPFNNPTKGGLDWSGEGRGSNTLTGWFVVDAVTYVGDTLTAIDLRFEQHCEGDVPALRGKIHWSQ